MAIRQIHVPALLRSSETSRLYNTTHTIVCSPAAYRLGGISAANERGSAHHMVHVVPSRQPWDGKSFRVSPESVLPPTSRAACLPRGILLDLHVAHGRDWMKHQTGQAFLGCPIGAPWASTQPAGKSPGRTALVLGSPQLMDIAPI
jgi:hypothetical protein